MNRDSDKYARLIGLILSVSILIALASLFLHNIITTTDSRLYHRYFDLTNLPAQPFMCYDALIENMGQPYKKESLTIDCRYVYALHYDGLIVYTNAKIEMVSCVEITGEQYRLGSSEIIGIGTSKEVVETSLDRIISANRLFGDRRVYSRLRETNYNQSTSLRLIDRNTWTIIDFQFNSNNEVERIRIENAA